MAAGHLVKVWLVDVKVSLGRVFCSLGPKDMKICVGFHSFITYMWQVQDGYTQKLRNMSILLNQSTFPIPETKRRQTFGKTYVKLYLQPLWLVIVAWSPGINFALLVQPGFPGLPSEHVHVECSENTGGGDLVVLYMSWFHPQGFRATWNSKIRSLTLPAYLCKWFKFSITEKKTSNSWRKGFNQDYCWRNLQTNKWKIANSRHFISTLPQKNKKAENVFYPGINLWRETNRKNDFQLFLSRFYFPVQQLAIFLPIQFDFIMLLCHITSNICLPTAETLIFLKATNEVKCQQALSLLAFWITWH